MRRMRQRYMAEVHDEMTVAQLSSSFTIVQSLD